MLHGEDQTHKSAGEITMGRKENGKVFEDTEKILMQKKLSNEIGKKMLWFRIDRIIWKK